MKEIDFENIRGRWEEDDGFLVSAGDDTIESIKMVAEKVNEIIEYLNDLL